MRSELDMVPQELRLCLEPALSEDPSQETLNKYLPHIRSIIFNLLNGLKQKQAAYKRLVTDREQDSPGPQFRPSTRFDVPSDPPQAPRSGESPVSLGSVSLASTSSQMPSKAPSSQALAERQRAGQPARPAPPDAFHPARMRLQDGNQPRKSGSPASIATEPSIIVRHQLVDKPGPSPPSPLSNTAPPPPPKPPPPHSDRFSRDSFGNPRPISRFSVDSDVTNGSSVRSLASQSPRKELEPLSETTETAPPSLPTLNLPSTIQLTDSSPSPPITETVLEVPPEARASLALIQRSDGFGRRASKRFSSYAFNRTLPGSPTHQKASSAGSPQRPTRRGERPPPMPAFPESMAMDNLGIAFEDDQRDRSSVSLHSAYLQANGNGSSRSSPLRSTSPPSTRSGGSSGSVRILKTPEPEDITQQSTPRPGDTTAASISPSPASGSFSVGLRIGRKKKKAILDHPVTLSSLRLLFMERFDYDPGMEDFPAVYIRDDRIGEDFELEDMDDVRESCVLSLNIDRESATTCPGGWLSTPALDQVKQYNAVPLATIMQEIKEMKTSFERSKRASMPAGQSLLNVSYPSHLRPALSTTEAVPRSPSPSPVSGLVDIAAREAEVKALFQEVQNVRRDLAIARQIHVDFLAETKESFAKLREQNTTMREVVNTKLGGSRALLDNSKGKLEAQCTDAIQAVEEMSDTIDAARADASRRFVTPSKSQMAIIQADLKKASDMVDVFTRQVAAVEPTFRATWHLELSRIMEEQKLVPYQKKLCADLKNDIEEVTDVFQKVEDFFSQRQAGIGTAGSKGFRPPSPDANGGIPNLLMEIRTKDGDPNQRLRAIEAQRKAREREKANHSDEFSSELSGFVQGKKLKKTGGTDEVDRTRQRKQEQTLKKMLTGDEGSPPSGMLSPQTTGSALTPSLTGSGRASRSSARSSGEVNARSSGEIKGMSTDDKPPASGEVKEMSSEEGKG